MKNWKKLFCVFLSVLFILGMFSGCRKQPAPTEPTTEPTEPTTEPIIYSITYQVNGGTLPYDFDTDFTLEDPAELPEPEKEHYEFAGWYLDENFSGYYCTDTVGETGDKIYYAKWVPEEYTITYELDGGKVEGNVYNPTSYNIESAEITLANPKKDGYTFIGWVDKDTLTENVTTAATEPTTAGADGSNTNGVPAGITLKMTIPTGSTGDRTFKAMWAKAGTTPAAQAAGRTGGGAAQEHVHNYVTVTTVKATCFEPKYDLMRCSCGHQYKKYIGDKLAHVWDQWILVKPETPEEKGIKKRSCMICKIVDSQFINEIITPEEATGQQG